MALVLVILLITVPIAELWLIIEVGGLIGVWPTVAILIADSLLGALLLRHQGRAAWRRFRQALAEHRMPHREVVDGVLVVFGGAFLLTPGFLTDAVGFILLIPPTRTLVRKALTANLSKRVPGTNTGFFSASSRRTGATQNFDVEGTAVDVTDSNRYKHLPDR